MMMMMMMMINFRDVFRTPRKNYSSTRVERIIDWPRLFCTVVPMTITWT